jgi:hypothetical protein
MDLIIPCNCFGFIFASKPERSFSSPFQQNTTTIILATLQQIAMSMTTHGPPCDSTTGIPSLAENLSLENANPTFTLFPKLPPELRLKILRRALPFSRKGRRFIEVKARIGASSRHSKEPCWFVLDDNAYSSDVKDVGLLRASKESRDAYLRYFDKSLRAKGQGLIRYQEDDIIYVGK